MLEWSCICLVQGGLSVETYVDWLTFLLRGDVVEGVCPQCDSYYVHEIMSDVST